MQPLISEFSYGYAVTDELLHNSGFPITAAPVFPSLYQEGQTGGYDVQVNHGGVPLFVQFKLADCLTTRSAKEAKNGHLSVPYYRMHFRSRSRSRQHQLLLELEALNYQVFYCAPPFHREDELTAAFLARSVVEDSIWIRPSEIGPLPDDDEHYAAFQGRSPDHFYFCSTPTRISASLSIEKVFASVSHQLDANRPSTLQADKRIDEVLLQLLANESLFPTVVDRTLKERDLSPIVRAAVLANLFFDANLYIAGLRKSI